MTLIFMVSADFCPWFSQKCVCVGCRILNSWKINKKNLMKENNQAYKEIVQVSALDFYEN